MSTHTIQVHYIVNVTMDVEVNDEGETTSIVTAYDPDLDSSTEPFSDGEVWDETAGEWRYPQDGEWETGSHVIDKALRAHKALAAIHAVMDGRDCGSDELGEIANIVWNAVGPLRSPEEALAAE